MAWECANKFELWRRTFAVSSNAVFRRPDVLRLSRYLSVADFAPFPSRWPWQELGHVRRVRHWSSPPYYELHETFRKSY
jgi:hypothetical protein